MNVRTLPWPFTKVPVLPWPCAKDRHSCKCDVQGLSSYASDVYTVLPTIDECDTVFSKRVRKVCSYVYGILGNPFSSTFISISVNLKNENFHNMNKTVLLKQC